jgi:DNA-binding transcriptional regulator YhcF (GntR family)
VIALRVDGDDPTPPYEQLRRQLADLIGTGVLSAGTRLPTVRQLAADLDLASGTVARTYRELEHAELVVTRRGGGTTVAPARTLSPRARRTQVGTVLADAVRRARLLGATDDEVRLAVAESLKQSPPSG